MGIIPGVSSVIGISTSLMGKDWLERPIVLIIEAGIPCNLCTEQAIQ